MLSLPLEVALFLCTTALLLDAARRRTRVAGQVVLDDLLLLQSQGLILDTPVEVVALGLALS